MNFLNRAKKLFQKNGWRKFKQKIERERRQKREAENYQKWIFANRLTETKRENLRREIENFQHKPLISIVLPVYNTDEKWLRLCIESVLNQIYENWELCIADDFSPSPQVRKILEEFAAKDKRIKTVFRTENGHISAASNSALELATGEFVALLDHDDELSADALFYVAKEINDFPEAQMIYSDEDMIDENGKRYSPKFKPDFSRELFYSVNYLTHLAVYRTSVLRKIGGFQIGVEGSQDYDLALRFSEEISENQIRHIPKILYHWRAIRGSVALSSDEKPYAHSRARSAIRRHLERIGKRATVSESVYNLHRVRYDLPENLPKVSLILTAYEDSDFTKKSIENFIELTDYTNFEIVMVTKEQFQISNFKFQIKPSENLESIFKDGNNAEKLNSVIAQTNGEILCFSEANLKPLSKDWLKELVGFALQKEVGAVGAKILSADESVLHCGLIVGTEEIISAAHCGFARNEGGNIERNHLTSNFSAVSVSCLCVRKNLFEEIGGFDALNLPNRFFDADFCLKLREKNYRIVFTPYAEFIKIDANKRLNLKENPTVEEKEYFVKKWSEILKRDEFYNPNLSKQDASFSIDI